MVFTIFDKITFVALVLGLGVQLLAWLVQRRRPSYRKFALPVIVIIILCQLTLLYGSFVEPRWIEVKHEQIKLASEPSTELKVILLADYHLGPYKQDDYVRRTVQMINAQNPDVVLIAGDFIYSAADQVEFFEPFSQVEARYGIYAVLGNHDYGLTRTNQDDNVADGAIEKSDYVYEKLEEYGIDVLRNENVTLDIEGKEVKLIGLEDMWGNRGDFAEGFADITADDTVLLLEHNPDVILDERSELADLIMTGHTHGGQIRLPVIGSLWKIPTVIGQEYDYGLFSLETGNQLYITKGLGEMGPRARLFCRPEIVVLELAF